MLVHEARFHQPLLSQCLYLLLLCCQPCATWNLAMGLEANEIYAVWECFPHQPRVRASLVKYEENFGTRAVRHPHW